MSAGLAERIVVHDRSEGPVLQCGVMGERPQKNDPFYFSLSAPQVVLSFLSVVFSSRLLAVSASGFILAPALMMCFSLEVVVCNHRKFYRKETVPLTKCV